MKNIKPSAHGPLVSVIIPCFNHGIYIDFAIGSILRQTFVNTEIIIVDDGSTDPVTISKLKQYGTSGITVLHQVNSGPGAARNHGFLASRGDYLLTLDADDLFHEMFIEKALKVFSLEPDVAAVSSHVLKFGYEDYVWKPTGGGIEGFILGINCVACALIKRSAWIQANGFNEGMRDGYEDWDFWIKVTKRGWRVHIIPEILFYYRAKYESRLTDTIRKHQSIYSHIRKEHADVFGKYFAMEDVVIS